MLKVASTLGLCCLGTINMLTCLLAFSYTQTLPSCLNLWGSQSAIRKEGGEGRREGREGGRKGNDGRRREKRRQN